MLLDTSKKNRICSALVMILCFMTYFMLYSTEPNVSTKPKKDTEPKTQLVTRIQVSHHEIQNRAPPGRKPPFQPPVKRNRIMSRVIHGSSFRMPKTSVNGKHRYIYKGKTTIRDTLKSKEYLKIPKIFYGDCFAYSAAGMAMRPPDVMNKNGCQKRLPKAMITGVKKCGTMMLTHYLSLHPLVAIKGEVHIPTGQDFTTDDFDKWLSEMQWSSPRMFSMTGKPLGFTWTNDTHGHLQSLMDQNAKLIMIIRDPVVRAVSDYVHTKTILSKNGSKFLLPPFNDIVIESQTGEVNGHEPIVSRGRYIETFRTVKALYGPNRLLVLDGEAFVQDPLPIMIKTESFLGLPKFFERKHFQRNPETGFYCANVPARPDFKCANPKIKGRPHPKVDDEISKQLYDYYRPFSLKLAAETGLHFQWLFQ